MKSLKSNKACGPDTIPDADANLPDELKFKFICEKCEISYPTKHGLSVHQCRHCKGRITEKKPSRKGTVAVRIITRLKIEEFQKSLVKSASAMKSWKMCTSLYIWVQLSLEMVILK